MSWVFYSMRCVKWETLGNLSWILAAQRYLKTWLTTHLTSVNPQQYKIIATFKRQCAHLLVWDQDLPLSFKSLLRHDRVSYFEKRGCRGSVIFFRHLNDFCLLIYTVYGGLYWLLIFIYFLNIYCSEKILKFVFVLITSKTQRPRNRNQLVHFKAHHLYILLC